MIFIKKLVIILTLILSMFIFVSNVYATEYLKAVAGSELNMNNMHYKTTEWRIIPTAETHGEALSAINVDIMNAFEYSTGNLGYVDFYLEFQLRDTPEYYTEAVPGQKSFLLPTVVPTQKRISYLISPEWNIYNMGPDWRRMLKYRFVINWAWSNENHLGDISQIGIVSEEYTNLTTGEVVYKSIGVGAGETFPSSTEVPLWLRDNPTIDVPIFTYINLPYVAPPVLPNIPVLSDAVYIASPTYLGGDPGGIDKNYFYKDLLGFDILPENEIIKDSAFVVDDSKIIDTELLPDMQLLLDGPMVADSQMLIDEMMLADSGLSVEVGLSPDSSLSTEIGLSADSGLSPDSQLTPDIPFSVIANLADAPLTPDAPMIIGVYPE